MDTMSIIQYGMIVMVSVFFTAISIDRQTMITYLLAGFAWLSSAIIGFILAPTGFSPWVSWFFMMLSWIFFGAFLVAISNFWADKKERKVEL